MKTFKDLVFKPHYAQPYLDMIAQIHFKNGYGISVITGNFARTTDEKPFELAFLYNNQLDKDTPFENVILPEQTESQINVYMEVIQHFKPR